MGLLTAPGRMQITQRAHCKTYSIQPVVQTDTLRPERIKPCARSHTRMVRTLLWPTLDLSSCSMLLALRCRLSVRFAHRENGSLSQGKVEPGRRRPKLAGAWVWVASSITSWSPDGSKPPLSSLHHRSLEAVSVPHWRSFLGAPPGPSACSSHKAPTPASDLASISPLP